MINTVYRSEEQIFKMITNYADQIKKLVTG